MYRVLPLAGLLTIIKSTGIIFAAIGLIFLIYTWLTHWSKPGWKNALAVVGTLWRRIGSLLWLELAHGDSLPGGREQIRGFFLSLQGMGMGKTTEQMREIISLFLKSSIDLTESTGDGDCRFSTRSDRCFRIRGSGIEEEMEPVESANCP